MIEAKLFIINLLLNFEVNLNDSIELAMREEFSYSPYNDQLIMLNPLNQSNWKNELIYKNYYNFNKKLKINK